MKAKINIRIAKVVVQPVVSPVQGGKTGIEALGSLVDKLTALKEVLSEHDESVGIGYDDTLKFLADEIEVAEAKLNSIGDTDVRAPYIQVFNKLCKARVLIDEAQSIQAQLASKTVPDSEK